MDFTPYEAEDGAISAFVAQPLQHNSWGTISQKGVIIFRLSSEKLLAAMRGGIKKVLIPEENVKDLAEIPGNVKDGLEIVPVSHVDEVLAHALCSVPEPIEWTEADDLASQPDHTLRAPSPTAH